MSSERKIHLLPHHAVRFVDCCEAEDSLLTQGEIFRNGPEMEGRVHEVLNILQSDPNIIILFTNNPKKDYICSGNGREDGNCFGVNNLSMSGCYSKESRKGEQKILDDMGLKLRGKHSFSEIVNLRQKTSWGKE